MNSAYDWFQLQYILKESCPLKHACTSTQSGIINDYASQVGAAARAAVAGNKADAPSGCYIDSCWVHEQNVNYCSGQGQPNCVGYSPLESGSLKWNYTTSVQFGGLSYTPQRAFSEYYDSRKASTAKANWTIIDETVFSKNPSCPWPGTYPQ